MTEISDELRREIVNLYLDRDAGDRQRARRRGQLAPDMPRDDWLREIARRAKRTGSSARASYDFLVTQLRPGEGMNLLSITGATLDELDELLRGDIPPESEPID